MRSAIRAVFIQIFNTRFYLEIALTGLFFVQALRYLVGALYGRAGSASLFPAIDPALLDARGQQTLISPDTVTSELVLIGIAVIFLPLLGFVLRRVQWGIPLALILLALSRLLMLPDMPLSPVIAAGLVIGSGLLYLSLVSYSRSTLFAYFFVLGLALDQVIRASGNTIDPSIFDGDFVLGTMRIAYVSLQYVFSGLLIFLGIATLIWKDERYPEAKPSLITFWGSIGLGALWFLQLSLLSTPNAIAGRSNSDYTLFAPLVLLATLLPALPIVRLAAKKFITLFDSSVRGWAWMLFVALLIVIGTRIEGVVAGASLVTAQFLVTLLWWWVIRPQAESERNFSPLWLIFPIFICAIFVVMDLFTYEYAYLSTFAEPVAFLNAILLPILRGLRGMGVAILLLGVFIAALPMIQTSSRVAWKGQGLFASFMPSIGVIVLVAMVVVLAKPPVVEAVRDSSTLRIATYNIHAGYSEFFDYDMEAIAQTIEQSGANVVLLQEVEMARMTSYGVDQALWLARRLGMDVRFYPTNEGLQGLSVLSDVEIVFDDGVLLTSTGNQTGVQRVQIRPDQGVITLYNTWLGILVSTGSTRTIAEQEQDQQRQLTEIFSFIGTNRNNALGRIVLGGTFNNVPDSDLIERVRQTGLIDPFDGQPSSQSVTLIQTGRTARIDYLWTNMLALGAIVVDSRASDHGLAVVEMQIER